MVGEWGCSLMVWYDPKHRPPQTTPPRDAFTIHRSVGRDRVSIAYLREGRGYPLVLLHGYPETKRIWWRNVEPLAAAGFEVIAPDLRGYGDFDTVPPIALDAYAAAGLDYGSLSALSSGPTGDYRELQGARPDELAAMLPTPAARRQWVAAMYTSRLWASPGTFVGADLAFMTEPFADLDRLRAGWAVYQLAHGRTTSEAALMHGPVDTTTLILYGADDHVVESDFIPFCERAFTNRIGPLVIPGAGHFLQWERADIVNPLWIQTFGDLR